MVLVAGGQHASPIEWLHLFNRNPEVLLLEQLPVVQDVSLESARVSVGDGSMSLPSFESFFGQSSDILYYTPHVKMLFSPFLATPNRTLWPSSLPSTRRFPAGDAPTQDVAGLP